MNSPPLLSALLQRLADVFSVNRLSDWLSIAVLNAGLAVCVFGLFYVVWRLINRILRSQLSDRIDRTTAAMLETAIKTTLLGIGVLVALSAAGVQTAAVLTSLGVLSLTIGFALKDTLSNMISGFLVFVDRPFTIDDLVEIDGQYGRVDRITLRTTRIITVDGRMLAGPGMQPDRDVRQSFGFLRLLPQPGHRHGRRRQRLADDGRRGPVRRLPRQTSRACPGHGRHRQRRARPPAGGCSG